MNHALVVDASLAVKWVLREEFSPQALALLRYTRLADQAIWVPPHFRSEVANAIYQRVRTTDPAKHLALEEAEAAFVRFSAVRAEVPPAPGIHLQAQRFAHVHGLPTVYDALYVVLAQLTDTELWTADDRLFRGVRAGAPWVRHIRESPLA